MSQFEGPSRLENGRSQNAQVAVGGGSRLESGEQVGVVRAQSFVLPGLGPDGRHFCRREGDW